MTRELATDRPIYLVDDETRTYRFVRRNPDWGKPNPADLEENKRQIDGHTRLFRDGHSKVFRYRSRVVKMRPTMLEEGGRRRAD